jgi:hypothetical protein
MGFRFRQNYFWFVGHRCCRARRFLRRLFFEKTEEDKLSMRKFRKMILAAALAAFSPTPLFACATCYGRSDGPLAHGINWGILSLLCIVVLMLSSIATFFFVYLRRAEAQAAKSAEGNLTEAKI